MAVKVNLYLDERRIETGEKAPVKLRLYISRTDIRHYHTNRYLTGEQFDESYLATKPKKALKDLKIALDAIVVKANNIITKMDGVFVLAKFEREMFGAPASATDVVPHYHSYINELNHNERSGTASNYHLSLKSLLAFAGKDKKPATNLPFTSITIDFLNRYEKWMAAEKNQKQQ